MKKQFITIVSYAVLTCGFLFSSQSLFSQSGTLVLSRDSTLIIDKAAFVDVGNNCENIDGHYALFSEKVSNNWSNSSANICDNNGTRYIKTLGTGDKTLSVKVQNIASLDIIFKSASTSVNNGLNCVITDLTDSTIPPVTKFLSRTNNSCPSLGAGVISFAHPTNEYLVVFSSKGANNYINKIDFVYAVPASTTEPTEPTVPCTEQPQTDGHNNTKYGSDALASLVIPQGRRNVAFGDSVLFKNEKGYANSAFGHKALFNNVDGYFNTAVGGFTLTAAPYGRENTAIGYKSQEFTNGRSNTSIGYQALQNDKGANNYNNVAIGSKAMYEAGSTYNIALGYSSLRWTQGSGNTALGAYALDSLRAGAENIAVGYTAGKTLKTGRRNIAIGVETNIAETGNDNIVIGYRSESANNNNIIIGKHITLPAGTNNSLNIGGVLFGSGLHAAAPTNPSDVPVNGRIGINVVNPVVALDVKGSVHIPTGDSYWIGNVGDSGNRLRLHHNNTAAYIDYAPALHFRTGTSPMATFASNGNVGIGTDNPYYKLDVNGTIRAKEVKINLNDGADFVFAEDYKLMNLSELDEFVSSNRHLPEIAPAAEMVSNGVDMGEFQIKLLQKIEELTLYIIEQDKRIKELEGIVK